MTRTKSRIWQLASDLKRAAGGNAMNLFGLAYQFALLDLNYVHRRAVKRAHHAKANLRGQQFPILT
jgi:hypothetical protein